MSWQVILAFVVAVPVVILSLALIWCLNIRRNVVSARGAKIQPVLNFTKKPRHENNHQ
jgi:hypothetical protein